MIFRVPIRATSNPHAKTKGIIGDARHARTLTVTADSYAQAYRLLAAAFKPGDRRPLGCKHLIREHRIDTPTVQTPAERDASAPTLES